jgi:HK97 family phage portal protein
MGFFSKLFRQAPPTAELMLREAAPAPIGGVPGVPSSTSDNGTQVTGASFQERITYVRGPEQALCTGTVYQAVRLRSDVMSVMPVQYQKKDFEKDNYKVDMRGLGKRMNYLLQEEPNPIMTATDLWRLVEINRLLYGNGFVYVERDEFDYPLRLWLVKTGGYNIVEGNYSSIVYLTDHGYVTKVNVPRRDVLHFPNTFRYQNGIWGISTLQYAILTLSLNRTLQQQSLETAGKGGRVKLLIGEQADGALSPIARGMFDKTEMDLYAQELQKKMYSGQDVLAIRGLDKVQNISMNAQEMQIFEQLGGTNDDVARYFGVPRPLVMLDTNSHYNDYQNATMEFHTRTILPQKTGNEKEIARKLIPRPNGDPLKNYGIYRIHICEKPLMEMDPERKAKYYESMLRTGIMTVNEMRAAEDMPRVEHGDIVYVLTNLAELGSAKLRDVAGGGRPTKETQPTEESPKEDEGNQK